MAHFQRKQRHEISGLIALVLFGVFAVSVLCVLLTGSGVYSRLVDRDRESYSRRTCAQYIATKVRQAGSGSEVSVEKFGRYDALTITEDIDGYIYKTRIYCCDGWLRELFASEEEKFDPGDGEKVIEADEMKLEINDGLLSVVITDASGTETSLDLYLRGREAEE